MAHTTTKVWLPPFPPAVHLLTRTYLLPAALYCPTNPSIETSTGVTFSRWRGAYPGAVSHFVAAKLDPGDDTWDQVCESVTQQYMPGVTCSCLQVEGE
jgi:hypothetical protein